MRLEIRKDDVLNKQDVFIEVVAVVVKELEVAVEIEI